ncbi:SirB1 family protein [Roseateles saccharophilus]|uniref:Regulator of sirC expression with transglutaminase-like and TPR domain n=1 Tax=Roseateles saccharophilus TaxID=304 RepID=A0A4R3V9H3_ROSSA|nr:transglutaminase-like domain-containing protein [Roseateles saccharophilus]MDG0832626.1 tetratricopeptide repeat protein [Roseateles saccharophilus]TCV00363.1 regulator of sirC expression with transglutaminase-like and TPR domain [Roseateles saccharophilus]
MRFAPPTPLDYFASLVAEDAGLNLLEAAVSLAQDEYPQLDVQAVLAEVDGLARRLRERVAVDAAPAHRLHLLTRFFHGELGFAGNLNNYYAPDNSFIHRVLQSRRGLPISLAVLLLELGEQIGLSVSGVAFPGHFLVKCKIGPGEAIVDPFTGESLSAARLDERLALYRQGSGLPDDLQLPLEFFLRAASPRQILARMLRNLKEVHRAAQDWPRVLAVQRRLVVLLPDDPVEKRDRGLALAALGATGAAAEDLAAYLAERGDAADAPQLRARLAVLLERGRPPLQ